MSEERYDAFISHASEDKESFVDQFYNRCTELGLKIWYDKAVLQWGSRLLSSIQEGLSKSDYGIVVLSKAFFEKNWLKWELDGFYALMAVSNKDNLLPILHDMSHQELVKQAPILAGILYRRSDLGVDALAQELYSIVKDRKQLSKLSTQKYIATEISLEDKQKFNAEFERLESDPYKKPSTIVSTIKSKGFWRVSIHPIEYKKERLTLSQCRSCIQQSATRHSGWFYPFYDNSNAVNSSDYVQGVVDHIHKEVWRMYQSGHFAHEFGLIEDYERSAPARSFWTLGTIHRMTQIFEFAKNIGKTGLLGDRLMITVEMHDLMDRQLRTLDQLRFLHSIYTCSVDSLSFTENRLVSELEVKYDQIALERALWTFERFNWTNPDIKAVIQKDQANFLKWE